jgi:hypothetical protein
MIPSTTWWKAMARFAPVMDPRRAGEGAVARAVEEDHIDLEWFSPQGTLQWSTLSEALPLTSAP